MERTFITFWIIAYSQQVSGICCAMFDYFCHIYLKPFFPQLNWKYQCLNMKRVNRKQCTQNCTSVALILKNTAAFFISSIFHKRRNTTLIFNTLTDKVDSHMWRKLGANDVACRKDYNQRGTDWVPQTGALTSFYNTMTWVIKWWSIMLDNKSFSFLRQYTSSYETAPIENGRKLGN